MLNIVCVQTDNFCGRGAEYVSKFFKGVGRHLSGDWRGFCITDDPTTVPDGITPLALPEKLSGWWNCLYIFYPGLLPQGERVIYMDLDTIFVGSLDDMAGYRGRFACMDNVYGPGIANGVMSWEAGTMDHIWNLWEQNWRPIMPEGDQQWIDLHERDRSDRFTKMFPGQLLSFKAEVRPVGRIPDNTRLIYFHGLPRPHEVEEPWVKEHWTNGD